METIKSYLDNMFLRLPDTPEIRRAKEELLGMMEDKYEELKAEGKSENEAVGTVISEFGDFDEILRDLSPKEERGAGMKTGTEKKIEKETEKKGFGFRFSFGRKPEELRQIALEEAKGFLEFQRRYAKGIGLGVALCILSPAILILGEGTRIMMTLSFLGMPFLFICVTLGVGLFIYYGTKGEEYEYLKKEPFILEEFAGDYVDKLREDNESLFRIQIIIGVALCILSAVPVAALETIPFLENFSIVFMLFFVAAGVFCLVHAGIVRSSYDILLQKGEYEFKKKRKHMNKR